MFEYIAQYPVECAVALSVAYICPWLMLRNVEVALSDRARRVMTFLFPLGWAYVIIDALVGGWHDLLRDLHQT